MSLSNPSTPFEVCAVRYIRHQQALGKRFNRERWVIGLMARFLAQQGACELDAAQFEAWCHARSYTSPNSRRGENLILRKFCLYRQRTEAECFVPDPLYFPRRVPAVRPVILGSEEIARLLEVIEAQPVHAQHPLRRPALRIAVILLYTAGLRCGELARLRLEDIDLKNRTLWIQATKFHKTRIVPLSPSAARELRDYLKVRLEAPWDISLGAGLLGHHHGAERFRPYSPASIGNALRSVLRAAKVRDPLGKMARVHDLRHNSETRIIPSAASNDVALPETTSWTGGKRCSELSEALQEIHNPVAGSVARYRDVLGSRCGERALLQLHVCVQINGCGLGRFVPEPECDHGLFGAVVKQVHCQGVAKYVRSHALACE